MTIEDAVPSDRPGWVVVTVQDDQGNRRKVEVRMGSRFPERPPTLPPVKEADRG